MKRRVRRLEAWNRFHAALAVRLLSLRSRYCYHTSLLTYLVCGSTTPVPSNGLAARNAPEGVGSWRKAVVVRAQAAAARRRSKLRQAVFEADARLLLLVVGPAAAVGDDDGGAMVPCIVWQ